MLPFSVSEAHIIGNIDHIIYSLHSCARWKPRGSEALHALGRKSMSIRVEKGTAIA